MFACSFPEEKMLEEDPQTLSRLAASIVSHAIQEAVEKFSQMLMGNDENPAAEERSESGRETEHVKEAREFERNNEGKEPEETGNSTEVVKEEESGFEKKTELTEEPKECEKAEDASKESGNPSLVSYDDIKQKFQQFNDLKTELFNKIGDDKPKKKSLTIPYNVDFAREITESRLNPASPVFSPRRVTVEKVIVNLADSSESSDNDTSFCGKRSVDCRSNGLAASTSLLESPVKSQQTSSTASGSLASAARGYEKASMVTASHQPAEPAATSVQNSVSLTPFTATAKNFTNSMAFLKAPTTVKSKFNIDSPEFTPATAPAAPIAPKSPTIVKLDLGSAPNLKEFHSPPVTWSNAPGSPSPPLATTPGIQPLSPARDVNSSDDFQSLTNSPVVQSSPVPKPSVAPTSSPAPASVVPPTVQLNPAIPEFRPTATTPPHAPVSSPPMFVRPKFHPVSPMAQRLVYSPPQTQFLQNVVAHTQRSNKIGSPPTRAIKIESPTNTVVVQTDITETMDCSTNTRQLKQTTLSTQTDEARPMCDVCINTTESIFSEENTETKPVIKTKDQLVMTDTKDFNNAEVQTSVYGKNFYKDKEMMTGEDAIEQQLIKELQSACSRALAAEVSVLRITSLESQG